MSFCSFFFKSFFKVSSNDVNPFYLRFKTNQKVSFSDISYILNNIQDYLANKIIEEKLSKVTSEYAKNKFIKYLPEEDKVDVKMNVMFDKLHYKFYYYTNSLLIVSGLYAHPIRQ